MTRTAFAEEQGTTILVIGGAPGEATHAGRLGALVAAAPLFDAGDYEAVAERGRS